MSSTNWLGQVAELVEESKPVGHLGVEDLSITSSVQDSGLFRWMSEYLRPLASCAKDGTTKFGLNCLYSDKLVGLAMLNRQKSESVWQRVQGGGRRVDRHRLTPALTIDICRREGVVWLTDRESNTLTVVYSGRTRWPALEAARSARDIVCAYLQHCGWHYFHSGAVNWNNETWLIIGDAGQGKTSLILALMSAGASYISNERTFVKKEGDALRVLSFPMPVAIGLGSALQYEGLLSLARAPETCLYPHRRMDLDRVRKTAEKNWPDLPDKIQLLPGELVQTLGASEAKQGGVLTGIVVPALNPSVADDNAESLTMSDARRVIKRNFISAQRDSKYPAWLELPFNAAPEADAPDLVRSLSELPAVKFNFYASAQHDTVIRQYPSMLHESMQTQNSL